MKNKWLYYAALIGVVVVWGLDPTVNSYFYRYFSASVLSSIATFTSAVFFFVLSFKRLKRLNKDYWRIALPISFLNGLGCVLQRIGLQYTTPASYAFLEHLSCAVVPVALYLMIRRKPTGLQLLSCLLCLLGCFVLSGMGSLSFGLGDLLCSIAGILIGVCVAATGVYAKKLDIRLYMTVYMSVYFLVSLGMAVALNFIRIDGVPMEKAVLTADPVILIAAAVFGLLSVGLCWLLKTQATTHLDPTLVAVISPFAAVITGVVSVFVGMDELTHELILGAVLILAAVLLFELGEVKKCPKESVR